jgi:hypothetical protein
MTDCWRRTGEGMMYKYNERTKRLWMDVCSAALGTSMACEGD